MAGESIQTRKHAQRVRKTTPSFTARFPQILFPTLKKPIALMMKTQSAVISKKT